MFKIAFDLILCCYSYKNSSRNCYLLLKIVVSWVSLGQTQGTEDSGHARPAEREREREREYCKRGAGAGQKVWRLDSEHSEDSSTPRAAGATEDSLLGDYKSFCDAGKQITRSRLFWANSPINGQSQDKIKQTRNKIIFSSRFITEVPSPKKTNMPKKANIFESFSHSAIQQFKEAFGIMDTDKDGLLSSSDLVAAFAAHGKSIGGGDAQVMIFSKRCWDVESCLNVILMSFPLARVHVRCKRIQVVRLSLSDISQRKLVTCQPTMLHYCSESTSDISKWTNIP